MDYENAIARIYEHLENDHVEKAVMGCLRVAPRYQRLSQRSYFPAGIVPQQNGSCSRPIR
jgi:hypothetical protein